MGHGIGSSLLTTLARGAYRHARRNGETSMSMHRAIDGAIEQQFDRDAFVTGVLARLDLDTGELTGQRRAPGAVAAARPEGRRRLTASLRRRSALDGDGGHTQVEALEPGDSLLLYTDGVIEARARTGAEFGWTGCADLLERRGGRGADTGGDRAAAGPQPARAPGRR